MLDPSSPTGNYDFVLSSSKAKVVRNTLKIRTTKIREAIDLTSQAQSFVATSGVAEGVLSCFNRHTTSAIVLGNRREGIVKLVPETLHDALEEAVEKRSTVASRDPETVNAYMSSTALGASVTIPIESGKLKFGDWQGLYLVEMSGPREREIVLTAVGI
jgi:secondary thiamine-phosphate synthase enzyme